MSTYVLSGQDKQNIEQKPYILLGKNIFVTQCHALTFAPENLMYS